jgi:hypothetical protein
MAAGRILTVQEPTGLARTAYGGEVLHVQFAGGWVGRDELAQLRTFDFVESVTRTDDGLLVVVDSAERDTRRVRDHFERAGVALSAVEPYEPTYDEMFVQLIARLTTTEERAAA